MEGNQLNAIFERELKTIRKGWEEDAERLHNEGGDELEMPEVFEDDFIENWE